MSVITKEKYLNLLIQEVDPEEIVDILGIRTEDMCTLMGDFLYLRRYRMSDYLTDDQIGELPEELDEELHAQEVLKEILQNG